MAFQFSEDNKYYAQLSDDGKLKIWETASNTLQQEYTPNLHLTSPCTCLQWIRATRLQSQWKKRKRRSSGGENSIAIDDSNNYIALGTYSGALLLYSLTSSEIESTLKSEFKEEISSICFDSQYGIITSSGNKIMEWSLLEKSLKKSWEAGDDPITSICIVRNKNQLITASYSITLWNMKTNSRIKSFIGHSTQVSSLLYVNPPDCPDSYVISSSRTDKTLGCWSLNEKSKDNSAIVHLLLEDPARQILTCQTEANTFVGAVTSAGVLHIFQHAFNGKCSKPIKPSVTIRTVFESEDKAHPIQIFSAHFNEDTSVIIAHGTKQFLTFENVVPDLFKKVQCLIRKDPRQIKSSKEEQATKSKSAIIIHEVKYLTPATSVPSNINITASKRVSSGLKTDLPMEERLENLSLSLDSKQAGGVPSNNVAHLLIQGLQSKDKTILNNALSRTDETTVKNTVSRLPFQFVVLLLKELSLLLQGKSLASRTGALWMKYVLRTHAAQLMSNPDLDHLFASMQGIIENRMSMLGSLSKLQGRVNLLVSQITESEKPTTSENDDALLVYEDDESKNSLMDFTEQSDSDGEWEESDSDAILDAANTEDEGEEAEEHEHGASDQEENGDEADDSSMEDEDIEDDET